MNEPSIRWPIVRRVSFVLPSAKSSVAEFRIFAEESIKYATEDYCVKNAERRGFYDEDFIINDDDERSDLPSVLPGGDKAVDRKQLILRLSSLKRSSETENDLKKDLPDDHQKEREVAPLVADALRKNAVDEPNQRLASNGMEQATVGGRLLVSAGCNRSEEPLLPQPKSEAAFHERKGDDMRHISTDERARPGTGKANVAKMEENERAAIMSAILQRLQSAVEQELRPIGREWVAAELMDVLRKRLAEGRREAEDAVLQEASAKCMANGHERGAGHPSTNVPSDTKMLRVVQWLHENPLSVVDDAHDGGGGVGAGQRGNILNPTTASVAAGPDVAAPSSSSLRQITGVVCYAQCDKYYVYCRESFGEVELHAAHCKDFRIHLGMWLQLTLDADFNVVKMASIAQKFTTVCSHKGVLVECMLSLPATQSIDHRTRLSAEISQNVYDEKRLLRDVHFSSGCTKLPVVLRYAYRDGEPHGYWFIAFIYE